MNKYYRILDKILATGKTQTNKKGNIQYLLNEQLSLTPANLLDIFEGCLLYTSLLQTVSVPRTAQTYRNRFTEQGRQQMQLKVGATAYTFHIDVVESGIDISEATYCLLYTSRCV